MSSPFLNHSPSYKQLPGSEVVVGISVVAVGVGVVDAVVVCHLIGYEPEHKVMNTNNSRKTGELDEAMFALCGE